MVSFTAREWAASSRTACNVYFVGAAGWIGVTVAVGPAVEVGLGIGLGVSVSDGGPNGVGEMVANGLYVMVGPSTVGMTAAGPAQERSSRKSKARGKAKERRIIIY